MAVKKKLTFRQQVRAIAGVARLTFQIAPGAVVFKVAGSVITAVLPIATTYFAARTTTELAAAYNGVPGAKHQVLMYVVLTAIAGLVMTLWNSVDRYVQTRMRYTVERRATTQMFEHFLLLDFWRYDDKHTADLYEHAQEFSRFFAWVFDRLATIISQFISVVTAIVALGYVNWIMALAVLVAVMPGLFIQVRVSRQQTSHWRLNSEVRRKLNLIEWNMLQPQYIGELRLYNMVNYLLRLREGLRDKDEKERMDIERRSLPLTVLDNAIIALTEVSVLVWTALQIVGRHAPLGQFLYVQQLLSRSISGASTLVSTLASIDEDVANLFDYEEFMHLPVRHRGVTVLETTPQVIAVDDVSFHYPGKKSDVLRHISLRIERGQRVAIVGENGAGKSTLIKLLTGLYQPTAGQITLDGTPLAKTDITSWHKQLGVLQQDFIAYNFATAGDNVRYGDVDAPHDPKRLEQAMRDAEAYDFVQKLPKGIDNYTNNWMEDDDGNKGTDLSGGQWQRLALARDFYRSSPIVILDEPTSAIDALAEARIFERLFAADQGRTVITISHRLSTIKRADVIYMLQDGKLVETGTYSELIAKSGAFYRMFESQIQE